MNQSKQLFERAKQVIPGGVNSPVRAFKSVGGEPRFIRSAEGAYLFDVDGHALIDYVGSWGPMILGHAHPDVIAAVTQAAQRGLSFGAPCEYEVLLAEMIVARIDSIEKVRMVNSGTEATMTAIRLARGFTGRDKIIKFEGCYHGHSDTLLVKTGSGALTLGVPSSKGVPVFAAQDTLVADFNDLDSVARLFEHYPNEIAAIIVEPVPGNMNMVLPKPLFLQGLRELCDRYHSVLIFDEVMTGFRVAYQGAQSLFSVTPDLTTFGKVIGGGMPVGAIGGRQDIMDYLSPLGSVYQAGTLSGNPIAMAAGLATLTLLTPEKYVLLAEKTNQLIDGLRDLAKDKRVPFLTNHLTGMFGLFFTEQTAVTNYADVMRCSAPQFNQFFNAMLSANVYLAPSAFEAGFVSLAHENEHIMQTLHAAEIAFEAITV